MPRGKKKATKDASASSTDLGALQREMEQIAEETNQLKQQERDLAKRKADVEKRLGKALKSLGMLDRISPTGDDDAPRRGRKPGRPAKNNGARKERAGGPRYTAEEKQTAVQFVDKAIKGGSTITDAIAQFNKSGKPRGKAPMNYQSLLRWRQG